MTDYPKSKLIPANMRETVAHGKPPLYRLTRPDYDRVPIDTFLVVAVPGSEGRVLTSLMRVVKPNNPLAYPWRKRTPEGRLLYTCWLRGEACKILADASANVYRHVIYPSDPEHHVIEMFKVACDTRHTWSHKPVPTKPTLLYRALGLDTGYADCYQHWQDEAGRLLT